MFPGSPAQSQIIGNSLVATGLLATCPAGMTMTANIQLTAAVALLGTASPIVTVNGAGAAPASGTVVARLVVSGLLASAAASSNVFEVLIKAPLGNDITLNFTAAGAGAMTAAISGWVFT